MYHHDTTITERSRTCGSTHDVAINRELIQDTTCLTVGEQLCSYREGYFIGVVRGHTVVHHCHEGLVEEFLRDNLAALEGCALDILVRLSVATADALKLLTNHRSSSSSIDITHEDDSHVLGAIPCLVEVDKTAQAGVFQVLGKTYDGTTVGSTLEGFAKEEVRQVATHVVLVHVVLLIYSLELSLEATENGVNKTLAVELKPLLELCGRECVVIYSLVITCTCVEALTTHTVNQQSKLVGSSILCSLNRKTVDFQSDSILLLTGLGQCHLVIFCYNLLVERFLLLPVKTTYSLCTLEHNVLEVVSQTGVLGGIIDRAYVEGHHTIYIGL